MKNSKIYYGILAVLMIIGIASCKKDSQEQGGKGAPVITRVRTVSKADTIVGVEHRITLDSSSVYDDHTVVASDSTVTNGKLNNQYAILGENLLTTNAVLFNGASVYFNPALITDKVIIITIPDGTPFGPSQSNKLTVVTKYGKVDFDFSIQQPPPSVTNFNPLAAGSGDIVTINGKIFNGVTGVKFDDVPAEIVGTPTNTQIRVKVPAGVVQSYIYVTTPGGTAKSVSSFGFKYIIYDDVLSAGWGGQGSGGYDGYGSTRKYNSTEHPKRGANAIAVTVDNGYGALQLGYGGATLNVTTAGLKSLKFSIYGGAGFKAGDRVQVVINGNYGKAYPVEVTVGAYTDYTIKLSDLGDPATISEITFQTLGVAAPGTFYVDDLGFI
ncbi:MULTISPECIES: IPT/TIG domain-containing protein [unclassified Mucilaginibacter]|uniref:IPT/TIG domain-containing protein n=1 Tax=unclassified Mucilaginibacter TaxID=2617802 RepID=UPI002AC9174A|nr:MULTISPECIES: IPT/TIG domain-containing protein [unclassified Mucilaginibacter]MEB0262211.1 IPT/TIG domain-containing protein [Mucilaginibacter sp. 10I4]MEB0278674.1 IPT/TIG domain-containing protein [Mucilaginibacter sp. 10B2]MEB0299384.1 IPT/TIG domain-containing protein [Mucilaginibacter sp. 5C4]WPX23374.1 IPT/TIG domain-containing protein [Mucilaginibacter sp. 5C4]